MPSFATAAQSAVFTSTQLWPMASLGSLPTCFSVTVDCVQSAATVSSFLSYCMRSLPVISSLADLVGARTAAGKSSTAAARAAASSVSHEFHRETPC